MKHIRPASSPGRFPGPAWRVLRSTGALCLLLWGLALPGAAGAAAPERTVPVASARSPVLRVRPAGRPADLPPRMLQLLEKKEEAAEMARRRLGPHGISRKGLQRRAERQAEIAAKGFAAVDRVDTLNVLVILIDFETDRSGQLTSVTEDGGFLCEPDTTYLFDPPPHGRDYFDAHIEGMGRYWNSMSRGRLHVQARVLPEADPEDPRYPCNAYSLSDIADYGPGSGNYWTIEQLVKLVQDMILKADEETLDDPTVNLADYDFDNPNTYIIFAHAGGDLQSNLVYQPGQEGYSPNDIPTFFVQLGDEDQVTLQSVDSGTRPRV